MTETLWNETNGKKFDVWILSNRVGKFKKIKKEYFRTCTVIIIYVANAAVVGQQQTVTLFGNRSPTLYWVVRGC